jgi:hypothetical protein
MTETTGRALAQMIEDVLIRSGLSMNNLRGQTYDGAANMAGPYNGCQAIIAEKQPLAMFVHCGAYCTNLIAQHATKAAECVRAAMAWLQELGTFYGSSFKFRQSFADIAVSLNPSTTASVIRPLCPTR